MTERARSRQGAAPSGTGLEREPTPVVFGYATLARLGINSLVRPLG
ncbi:hypothetical protein [Geodermatophilus sp. DF01-2]|nr:hypothetical protein [Geodermatophilus sp. DF01_2]